LGYDESDIIFIRPDLSLDETDKQIYKNPETKSNRFNPTDNKETKYGV